MCYEKFDIKICKDDDNDDDCGGAGVGGDVDDDDDDDDDDLLVGPGVRWDRMQPAKA